MKRAKRTLSVATLSDSLSNWLNRATFTEHIKTSFGGMNRKTISSDVVEVKLLELEGLLIEKDRIIHHLESRLELKEI